MTVRERLTIDGVPHYYEIAGHGDPVLLLHGGFCTIESLEPQVRALSADYRIYMPERRGHGRTPDRIEDLSYAADLEDTLAYLDAMGLDHAHVIGFSDGAILGLMLAVRQPQRVRSLIAISGNLDPTGYISDDENLDDESLDDGTEQSPPEPADEPGPLWREHQRLSPDGPAHTQVVWDKIVRMWQSQPNIPAASLAAITAPTMVMAADRDAIRTEHTALIAGSIPHSQLCIIPGASHMLMTERPELVNAIILDFLAAK